MDNSSNLAARVHVRRLLCKNFRCFSNLDVTLQSPIVICEDKNGSGKTSFLEALYYACYLRSFRTHLPRELIQFDHANFFVRVELEEKSQEQATLVHDIQVGFCDGKRLAKVNTQVAQTHKDIIKYYRTVSFTEDDLALVKGTPEIRRDFLDMALILEQDNYRALLRTLKQVVERRNALLSLPHCHADLYLILSRQLLHVSRLIQQERVTLLGRYNRLVNAMLTTYNEHYEVVFDYRYKQDVPIALFEGSQHCRTLFESEVRMGRSLWGAHLDDFSITFNNKRSRTYASRGQQKLLVLLMKNAHVQEVAQKYGTAILLLDDFMTDLDQSIAMHLTDQLVKTQNQLIFTAPTNNSFLAQRLRSHGAQQINLTL
jgi:DNA replication and repair protein RecF